MKTRADIKSKTKYTYVADFRDGYLVISNENGKVEHRDCDHSEEKVDADNFCWGCGGEVEL